MKVLKRSMALLLTFVIVMCATFVIVDAPTYAASRIKTPVIKGVYAVDDEYLEVNWTGRSNVLKYNVYRATSKYGNYNFIGSTKNTRFNDDEVFIGKTYYYKVKAKASKAKYTSKFSKIKSGIIPYFDDNFIDCYAEQPNVPDFGSFIGIEYDSIIREGVAIGYCYANDAISKAGSRYDKAIDAYGRLLQTDYGFKYEGQERYDHKTTALMYSLKQGINTINVSVMSNTTLDDICVWFWMK